MQAEKPTAYVIIYLFASELYNKLLHIYKTYEVTSFLVRSRIHLLQNEFTLNTNVTQFVKKKFKQISLIDNGDVEKNIFYVRPS